MKTKKQDLTIDQKHDVLESCLKTDSAFDSLLQCCPKRIHKILREKRQEYLNTESKTDIR